MRISVSNRFMLFHVPRTGVSSLIAALDDSLFYRAPPTRRNRIMSKIFWFVPRPFEQTYLRVHESARQVRRLLPREMFDDFLKIAFVRNPYSWLVSLYEIVLQSPAHRHHRAVSSLGGFSAYVDWEIARDKRHQHRYLMDRAGRLLVDEIGRFERLEDDARRIFAQLDIEPGPLPQRGRFTRGDYREYYDETSRRKVQAHWAQDLESFGYDYDGVAD